MEDNRKTQMKFSMAQLERIIIALMTNSFNKKFASNVDRLFRTFKEEAETEKAVRQWIIVELTKIILKNDITGVEPLLSFFNFEGKYEAAAKQLMEEFYENNEMLTEGELELLDKTISDQIKYNSIVNESGSLSQMLTNFQAGNYDNMSDAIEQLETTIDTLNKDIKSARESIQDAKKDVSLSNSGFVNFLKNIIDKERSPSYKVKSGIQYLNMMFDGGFEPGRLYVVMAPSKGWKS